MFAGEVISQAVTRHFGGPVESGICFGIPRHHLKRNGRIVLLALLCNKDYSISNRWPIIFDLQVQPRPAAPGPGGVRLHCQEHH